MPVDWSKYPDDWQEIATNVKNATGWKCQKCGKQCRFPGEEFDTHKRTLTVAHINHIEMDFRPESTRRRADQFSKYSQKGTMMKTKQWIVWTITGAGYGAAMASLFFHFAARPIYLDAIKQQQETIEVLKQDLQHWESYAEKSRGISI